jgi:hypothetical protein
MGYVPAETSFDPFAEEAARVAARERFWSGLDESQQRTYGTRGNPAEIQAAIDAQIAAANLSAAGGMEFGGLLGIVEESDDPGGTGSRGMFGGEVGYGSGR